MPYTHDEKEILLQTVRDSINYGLSYHTPMPIELSQYPKTLQQARASFVTLHLNHQLRGCIGSLQAHQPLIQDVAHNAFSAAFLDSRFYPVTPQEYELLTFDISVLSTATPITFKSEQDLIRQLRPGIDGLILTDAGHRGTFLPAVWEELSDPKEFLNHLKIKAGLSQGYWSDTLQIERYTVESIA